MRVVNAPSDVDWIELPHDQWRDRFEAHRERMVVYTGPARERRDRRVSHPIEDFLFQYYPFPFSLLENWHPPAGSVVQWPSGVGKVVSCYRSRYYKHENDRIRVAPEALLEKERARLWWVVDLLEQTAARAANFGCHGLHEWAMVYDGAEVRHELAMDLRLSRKEIDDLVRSRPIHCTHFDAFRFFSPAAQPLNRVQPELLTREKMEQPACVHANMDLYKWAAKSMPWVGSDLLVDCFELALKLRRLDMQASPYDVSRFGLPAIRIETPDGRKQYEAQQRRLADKASILRARLRGLLRTMLESL